MKYRKKPVVIEAIQFKDNAESIAEISNMVGNKFDVRASYKNEDNPVLIIPTLEGEHIASVGDYIIKGVNGEFYPCKPDIFEKTYDTEDSINEKNANTYLLITSLLGYRREDTIETEEDIIELTNNIAIAQEENEFMTFINIDGVKLAVRANNIECIVQINK